MSHKHEIMIEDQKFDSIIAGANYIGVDPAAITWAIKHSGKCKGLKITDLKAAKSIQNKEGKMEKVANKITRAGTVVVANNGTTYRSIKQLAEYIKVPDHVISNTLSKQNKFIYQGITYTTTKPHVKRNRTSKYAEIFAENPGMLQSKPVVKSVETSNIVKTAKSILKEKIAAYIQSDNFTMAKELMDVVEQIKE